MTDLVIPIVFMLVVVIGEALILQASRRTIVDWHDVVFNLNSGHIVLWLFRGLEVTCYGLVAHYCSLHLLAKWPTALIWLFTLIAWDFGFYWLHRLHHRIGLLWAVHVVHHQGQHFNLSLGVRNSWYSSLTSIPFFLPLAVLGVPLSVFISVSLLHYGIQLFNHSALTPPLGPFEKVMVTPAHHRVHHLNDRRYADSNFGGSFIFWDKLFGTFRSLPQEPIAFGAGKARPSRNPVIASNRPFMKYFHRWPYHANQPSTLSFRCSGPMLLSGALLLFLPVAGYIYRFGYGYDSISVAQITLLIILAAGTLALGGISEGRRWGLLLWLITSLSLLVEFALWHWMSFIWLVLAVGIVLHSAALAFGVGRTPLSEGARP